MDSYKRKHYSGDYIFQEIIFSTSSFIKNLKYLYSL